jgi:RNA polymerase sigma-70 factor (ECF subfamily)
MSTTPREAAIAARRGAHTKSLFESVARRFYAGVYNYLRWMSRDAGLAEDLTQETFMRIWQHPPELRSQRALKAWVFRVARNEFLQHRRRAGLATVALGDPESVETASGPSSDPQMSLEREDLRRAVRGAVQKLPDHYREVIVLYNLDGLSLAQIAEVLEIPLGTVKSRRAKALTRLRHLLQEVGNDGV